MTAEIGILNKHGVALAADSAVTISTRGKQKVLNSANKLFNLIKGYPVGLMIYGNGDFLGIPWEIIINDFRENNKITDEYNNLYDYAESFISSLKNEKFYSKESYSQTTYSNLNEYINIVIDRTKSELSNKYPNREITKNEARDCFVKYLKKFNDNLDNMNFADGFSLEDINYIIGDEVNTQLINICLKEYVTFEIDEEIVNEVKKMNSLLQCKDVYINYSGVVISGFGKDDYFPKLYEFKIYGIVNNKLKYSQVKDIAITATPLNNGKIAEIVPFAQQEMVKTILNGMDPNLYDLIINNLEDLLGVITESAQRIFNCNNCEKVNDNIEELRKDAFENVVEMMKFINNKAVETYTEPVLSMVASLPKDELATMAETLVNLTSFKRKITMDEETVGGPIDVAIISKSEGFIWMKRKLYFSGELNKTYYNK